MSLEYIRKISHFFEPGEFEHIKISGDEPTLHKEFAAFCSELKTLFPSKSYSLASNGKKLKKFIDDVKVFDWIDLSRYPELNDREFEELLALNVENIRYFDKHDGQEMMDIRIYPNRHLKNVYQKCESIWPRQIYKVV